MQEGKGFSLAAACLLSLNEALDLISRTTKINQTNKQTKLRTTCPPANKQKAEDNTSLGINWTEVFAKDPVTHPDPVQIRTCK